MWMRYARPHLTAFLALGAMLIAGIAVQISTPYLTSLFIDRIVDQATVRSLTMIAIATVVLSLVGQALAVGQTWVSESLNWSSTNALREDLAEHVLTLDTSFHSSFSVGDLLERIDGDVSTLSRFFSSFLVNLVSNALLLVGALTLLLVTSWQAGAIMTLFSLLTVAVMTVIRARTADLWVKDRNAATARYGLVSEYLQGIDDLQTSNAVPYALHNDLVHVRDWYRHNMRARVSGYALVGIVTALFSLGVAGSIWMGTRLVISGTLSIGTIYLIYRYAEMIQRPIFQIREEFLSMQLAEASMKRIGELLAKRPIIADGPGAEIPDGPLAVRFEGVTFAYHHGTPVLRNFDLHVRPGRVTALVGRTGSGKTTVARLIPRLMDPDHGRVTMNGVDLRDACIDQVRCRVGFLTQDIHIFGASIRDNVTLFNAGVSDCQVLHALRDVGLEPWLMRHEQGLETMLSSGGSGLSAGEAQLIACARLLITDPDLFVLDEASSRLDPVSERTLHRAFSRILQGRTGVLIAHRLTTLSLADDIAVVQAGRIVEYGERETLDNDPGSHYRRLLAVAAGEAGS